MRELGRLPQIMRPEGAVRQSFTSQTSGRAAGFPTDHLPGSAEWATSPHSSACS